MVVTRAPVRDPGTEPGLQTSPSAPTLSPAGGASAKPPGPGRPLRLNLSRAVRGDLALLDHSPVAVVAPILAWLIPRRLVPEVVLLLGLGTVIGPYGVSLAAEDDAIALLSELGLGFLFLLAGFEISRPSCWAGPVAEPWPDLGVLPRTGVRPDRRAARRRAGRQPDRAGHRPHRPRPWAPCCRSSRTAALVSSPVGASVLRARPRTASSARSSPSRCLLGSRGAAASVVVLGMFALIAVVLASSPPCGSAVARPGCSSTSGTAPKAPVRRRCGRPSCSSSRWARSRTRSTSTSALAKAVRRRLHRCGSPSPTPVTTSSRPSSLRRPRLRVPGAHLLRDLGHGHRPVGGRREHERVRSASVRADLSWPSGVPVFLVTRFAGPRRRTPRYPRVGSRGPVRGHGPAHHRGRHCGFRDGRHT